MEMWQLSGTRAQLNHRGLRATVDVRQPQRGVREVCVSQKDVFGSSSFLQLNLPGAADLEELRDIWIRGADLVAVYAPTSQRSSQPEIYWRCVSANNADGLEIIVSVQTGVLDDHPAINVVSEFSTRELWWLPQPGRLETAQQIPLTQNPRTIHDADGAGLYVIRMNGSLSYVEMIFPSDFCSTQISSRDDRVVLRTSLFPERLEKGVIRRGRLRGWFVPAADDLAAAARLFDEFTKSEPPLTT